MSTWPSHRLSISGGEYPACGSSSEIAPAENLLPLAARSRLARPDLWPAHPSPSVTRRSSIVRRHCGNRGVQPQGGDPSAVLDHDRPSCLTKHSGTTPKRALQGGHCSAGNRGPYRSRGDFRRPRFVSQSRALGGNKMPLLFILSADRCLDALPHRGQELLHIVPLCLDLGQHARLLAPIPNAVIGPPPGAWTICPSNA